MGVQFSGYSASANRFYPSNVEDVISLHGAGAGWIGKALGIEDIHGGGTMSLREFEARIFRNADGHPDPYVAERLIRLAQLVRDVRKNMPSDAVISYG